jgi:hypothetical protein
MKYIEHRITPDNEIYVTYLRPANPDEGEDREVYKMLIPGTDVSQEAPEIQALALQIWTADVIQAHKTKWGY